MSSSPRRRGSKLMLVACIVAALNANAARTHEEPARGFRFQIVPADDSEVTHRIVDDLSRRLVPLFSGFRTELAQRRRMLYVAIGPSALRDVAARVCDCVVIAAFTSSQVFRSVVAGLPPARAAAITAV